MVKSHSEDHKLEIVDINTYYGDSHVLQGCSLSVGRECVAVLGRNGMGKTTLLRSIIGLNTQIRQYPLEGQEFFKRRMKFPNWE